MQDQYSNQSLNSEDEIDLKILFNTLLQGKWLIFSFTAFASIIAVIYSLSLPNIYESKALLAPVKQSGGISGALQNYSGLAGLAGIDLSSGSDMGNTAEAIEKISSLSFFKNNLIKNMRLPDIMAVKAWDPKTNTLVYDNDIYDSRSNAWVRDYSYPKNQIPSVQESFGVFLEEHLNLSKDKQSGFITLSIKHQSPYIAKQWVELVVNEVNHFYRTKDKLESQKAINFLNQQISNTSFSEIKEVLAQLMQDQIKKLTLVEASEFYVFEYIEPPEVMERKSEPKRALISILGSILGGIIAIISVLLRYYFKGKDLN